ncbi:FNIP repeat-containing protein [Heterostelium album PN500]|uniref:FNIP repeat-containing protein n=1 Tax=Heterostelium pallidum (strain ATCC 26659 / Pp 5 / PN500) TaxID=670386 RepID=D3B2J0_HETP5|nr:FNIP repeat-containing protein [Heterostelium album PN500]EFA83538.1 FNIP repeat-containing protein [Heterostelium album PN500]|eukprot:XP_020435655.1 FNIP repeat-containing protein [Heterostelium album PN500]
MLSDINKNNNIGIIVNNIHSNIDRVCFSLACKRRYHLKSALSPTIKYLYLHSIQNDNGVQLYDYKEIFPETIQSIVDKISENIDRVCFSLVCKRFFDNRDKYLLFDANTLKTIPTLLNNDQQNNKSNEVVGSYQSIYSTSLELKENATMIIRDNQSQFFRDFYDQSRIQFFSDFYDFVYDQKTLSQYGIPSNVRSLFLSPRLDLPEDALLSSNITKIIGFENFKLKLPPTTKILHFGNNDSNVDLTKDCFPSGLEELKMRRFLRCHLTFGMLPDGLNSIYFGLEQDQPIEPGVLPSSLRQLTLILAKPNQLIKMGVLPPNLEYLQINGDPPPNINEHYLPKTLQTLELVPSSWIPLIKSLPNLTTLSLKNRSPTGIENVLNLSDLPPTLTSLTLKSGYHLKSALSPTIKYLYLHSIQNDNGVQLYDFKEMFPETIQYHLEELSAISLPESVLPNLKIDKFIYSEESVFSNLQFVNKDRLEVKVMKEGIEQSIFKSTMNLPTLPYGIKYLRISLEDLIINTATIPTSVETIEIVQITVTCKKLPFYVIPDFIRTLIIDFSFEYPLYIPPTLTNIIFKYLSVGKDKCQIRKIDSNYYLLFGWLHKDNYQDTRITKIIHKSNFNHYFRKSQLFIE